MKRCQRHLPTLDSQDNPLTAEETVGHPVAPLRQALVVIVGVYLIAYTFRLLELMILRTDQSGIGEAFIHKLAGIVLLVLAVRFVGLSLNKIGFVRATAVKSTLLGLVFGLSVFFVAY